MNRDRALDVLQVANHGGPVDSAVYNQAFEVVYGYPPLVEDPEEVPVKKPATIQLLMPDLRSIVAAMELAENSGVGTFHMPSFDNIKVKFDKESGDHYIVARLL